MGWRELESCFWESGGVSGWIEVRRDGETRVQGWYGGAGREIGEGRKLEVIGVLVG